MQQEVPQEGSCDRTFMCLASVGCELGCDSVAPLVSAVYTAAPQHTPGGLETLLRCLQFQLGCPWPAAPARQTDEKQTHRFSDGTSICSATQHARESGAYVARELLGKQQPDYDYMPYFYSRIYDLGWVVRPPTRLH